MTEPIDLHYELEGPPDAPVVVLGSSIGTASAMWAPQVPALSRRFRVLRYDHRGHGRSPAPPGPYELADLGRDVLALLDRLDLDRVAYAGLSLGGMVGMWLGVNAPERISSLVLCCTSPYLGPPDRWQERIELVRTNGTGALVDAMTSRYFSAATRAAGARHGRRVPAGPAGHIRRGLCRMLRGDRRDGPPRGHQVDHRADPRHLRRGGRGDAGRHGPGHPGGDRRLPARGAPGLRPPGHDGAARAGHGGDPRPPRRATPTTAPAAWRSVAPCWATTTSIGPSPRTTPFTAPFQDLITRYAWGEVWDRPGLDRATRSAITLGLLVALDRPEELAMHVRAARRNGLTPAQISEVLLHSAIYCGVPAANAAFAVAARVLDEEEPRCLTTTSSPSPSVTTRTRTTGSCGTRTPRTTRPRRTSGC